MNTYVHRKACTVMLIAASIVIIKELETTQMSINWRIDFLKLWCNPTVYTLCSLLRMASYTSFMLVRFVHVAGCIRSFLFIVE